MKVVILAHFFEIVEKRFNYKRVDKPLPKAALCPSLKEIHSLVGAYPFQTFNESYHYCIKKKDNAIHNYATVEAKFPYFDVNNTLIMNDLYFGEISSIANRLIEDFKGDYIKKASIKQKSLKTNGGLVKFVITRQ